MIRVLALCLALVGAGAGLLQAQEGGQATGQTADQSADQAIDQAAGQSAPDPLPGPQPAAATGDGVIGGIDYDAWRRTALRTATITENGSGSSFALERLRSDMVGWRDRFLLAQEANSSRIATVNRQIGALGAAAADEDPRIAARRAALTEDLSRLRAPVLLAQEAYAQADGLVAEIDSLLRARQTNAMTSRGLSPLNPGNWPEIGGSLGALAGNLWVEATVTFRSQARREILFAALPRVLFFLALGAVLTVRGRPWSRRIAAAVSARLRRGAEVWTFVILLGQLVLPYLGLVALVHAVTLSGLPGFRLMQVISQIPYAGAFVILSRWLAEQLFSERSKIPLAEDFSAERRREARGEIHAMGWIVALGSMALAVLGAGDVAVVAQTAVALPVQAALSWYLYRFGRLLLPQGGAAAGGALDAQTFQRGLVTLMGRAVMVVAAAAPVLTAIGFSVAGEALAYPTVMTLALIGIVMILQAFVFDLYVLVMGRDDTGRDALLPVVIGVLLAVAALPALTLFWGARVEDLSELWSKFQEGWTIGDARISPTDFLMAAVIFVGLYLATRLLQGVLRTTILPKTRLDPGARTAIIAGAGYIGIFLAGLFAVSAVGLDLSNLAIVAGALSVGIGFGLQNIVSNFISGIILLIERPISEGDWIEVADKSGYVRSISVRSTLIETFDRSTVVVPNTDLIAGRVTNWTRGSAAGRIIVPVSVMFGSDTDKVTAILREVAENHPMVLLNPAPSVVLQNFGADILNFEIRAIVRDINFGLSIRSEMNVEIANRFFAEGVEFAGGARGNGAAGRTATSPKAATPEMRVTLLREPEPPPPGGPEILEQPERNA